MITNEKNFFSMYFFWFKKKVFKKLQKN